MNTIIPIQALRALAAISVFIVHFDTVRLRIANRDVLMPLHAFASGVDLFFVISGFVMVYSSERLFGTADAQRQFLMRRIARIVPLYWTITLISLLVPPHGVYWRDLLYSLLFFPFHNQPVYGVGWTLDYEMFFYAIFSTAIVLRRQIAIPTVLGALCIIVILGKIFRPANSALQFWSDPIILEFAYGMVIASLLRRGGQVAERSAPDAVARGRPYYLACRNTFGPKLSRATLGSAGSDGSRSGGAGPKARRYWADCRLCDASRRRFVFDVSNSPTDRRRHYYSVAAIFQRASRGSYTSVRTCCRH